MFLFGGFLNKRTMIGVVVLLLVGSLALSVLTGPDEDNEGEVTFDPGIQDNGVSEEETPETPVEPDPEPEEPPVVDVPPSCYKIPAGPVRNNSIPRIIAVSNESTVIDPVEMFNASSGDGWAQVYMEMIDTWYASNYRALLEPQGNETIDFTASEPGVYRLQFNNSHLIEVEVRKEIPLKLDVKGAIFGDVWDELGSPEFNIAPEDSECRDLVLGHAMEGPLRVGANWVGVVPALFYTQVLPFPEFATEGTKLSLANETYYAALVDAAHSKGLNVMHVEQTAPYWNLTQDDYDALESMWYDQKWSDAWFSAWKKYIVPRAEMVERHGVEMFVLYLFPEGDTFKAEGYVEGWRDIIAGVREVYSGQIAFNVVNADERVLPLLEDIDVLLITIFPGLYSSGIDDLADPTPEQIAAITEGFFNAPREYVGGKLPVYYVFSSTSSDGQKGGEASEWKLSTEGLDFREQVVYYEGVFKAMEDEEWINGFIPERWDYFDQYDRVGESYESYYYDHTRGASPRSKPAEDLINLWFDLR